LVLRESTSFEGDALHQDHGDRWQAGAWSVTRRGGEKIEVLKVYRRSSPRGLASIKTGFGSDSPRSMKLEHRVYLELAEAVGQEEILRVAHRGSQEEGEDLTALDLILPFSDLYTETPVLQVNQVGYNPRATRRYGYLYEWLGDGGGLSLANFPDAAELLVDGGSERTGREWLAIQPAGSKPDGQGEVKEIDLSSVAPSEGTRLRLRIPGVGVSVPTAVSEASAVEAFVTVARGIHYQRRCEAFGKADGGVVRPRAHCEAYWMQGRTPADGFFPHETVRKDRRRLEGGHYDAGDFDIRPYHVLVAQNLLRAFELGPQKFGDGQFHAAARKNGVPDLLDEALHSVQIWQGLQDKDGGVREGIESTRHPWGYYYAHEDELDYFTYDAAAGHTALVAGLFAQAAFLVKPYDATRSVSLQRDALAAYGHAKSKGAPAEYLLYPAGELARLIGEPKFGEDFVRYWRSIDRYGRGAFDHLVDASKIYPGSFHGEHPAMADYVVGYAATGQASPEVKKVAGEQFAELARAGVSAMLESASGHRSAMPELRPPDWGQFVAQGRHFDGLYQALSLSGQGGLSQGGLDAMSLAADTMLGCNAAGMSFVTGLGTVFPRQPLHLDSLASIAAGGPAVPGIVVYGPVANAPSPHYYAPALAAFYPSFEQRPLTMRYADNALFVNTSEFTVWETQAPSVLLFAALLPPGHASGR
jgi:endoglucanase